MMLNGIDIWTYNNRKKMTSRDINGMLKQLTRTYDILDKEIQSRKEV